MLCGYILAILILGRVTSLKFQQVKEPAKLVINLIVIVSLFAVIRLANSTPRWAARYGHVFDEMSFSKVIPSGFLDAGVDFLLIGTPPLFKERIVNFETNNKWDSLTYQLSHSKHPAFCKAVVESDRSALKCLGEMLVNLQFKKNATSTDIERLLEILSTVEKKHEDSNETLDDQILSRIHILEYSLSILTLVGELERTAPNDNESFATKEGFEHFVQLDADPDRKRKKEEQRLVNFYRHWKVFLEAQRIVTDSVNRNLQKISSQLSEFNNLPSVPPNNFLEQIDIIKTSVEEKLKTIQTGNVYSKIKEYPLLN